MRIVLRFIMFVLLFVGISLAPAISAGAAPTPAKTTTAASTAKTFGERVNSLTEVTGLRFSIDGEGKARVVVDAQKGELKFKQSAVANPNRIIVDVENAWLSPAVSKETVIGGYVKKIRVAQFDKTTVRIVAETDATKDAVHVFSLANPERLVMDFGKVKTAPPVTKPIKQPTDNNTGNKTTDKTINKTADKDKAGTNKTPPPPEPPTKQETPSQKPKVSEEDEPLPERTAKTKTDKRTDKEDTQEKHDREPNDDELGKNEEDDADSDIDERIAAIIGMKGKVICIDPGHGGPDVGAIGPTGVTEKSVTFKVATELRKLLEKEGAKVILTRTSDKAVHAKGAKASAIEELQARCDIANDKKADIFISIHADAFTNNTAKGTTAYYYEKGTKASKKLADALRSALIEEIKTVDRGTQSCNFYVVRKTDMPATLIELAFLSNEEEEQLLDSEEGIKKAAQGLLDGIADYFG